MSNTVLTNKGLSIKEFWEKYGRVESEKLALEAGTTYPHFKHLAHGRRNPSKKLAERLVNASGKKLSLARLLYPAEATV